MKCKRILSLLLTLCMVMSLFAGTTVTASAADGANGATTLYVNGVDMLNGSSTVDGVSYNKETNTLTLTNAALNQFYIGQPEYDKYAAVIYAVGGNLTIELIGDNKITYSDATEGTWYTCGICFYNVNLTITGGGKLAIQNTATESKARYYEDICGEKNSSLTINGATVECVADSNAETLKTYVYGISLSKGALTVHNGQLTVRTRKAASEAYGIALHDVEATHILDGNSKVTAVAGIYAGNGSSDYSYGIHYMSTIQLGAGAKLYASGEGMAIYENESSITAADGAMLSVKGKQEYEASSGLTEIQISNNTIKANAVTDYKTIEVTASASTPAAPTFTDGLGKTDCTFDTYTKDRENEKGYTFAGWFNGETELTSADAAVAGTTYTAKWTKNGKTVRTTALDFYNNEVPEKWKAGCTQEGTLWTNDAEGWRWDTASQTLTLNGVTIDTQLDENTYGAIEVFDDATIKTVDGTENFVCSHSEDGNNAAIYVEGGLTISGKGKLTVAGETAGVDTEDGDIHINAPLSASAIGSEPEAAIRIASQKTYKITIDPSLTIKQPEGGYIGEEEMCILEKDGKNAAMNVVIAAAAPTFTDGLGKADCTFDTYTKGAKNDKGYIFVGWFDGDTELENAEAAVAGTTYTAKWTKNGKTVRTAVLDLTEINEENTFGATLTGGVYTNADEGWSWNPKTETLTLSGVTFDVNKQSTEPNIEGIGAILLPGNASVTTKEGTENTLHNGSTIGTTLGTYIGSGIVSEGAFTIKGDGELSVTAGAFGVFAMGDVSIGAPISIVCTETKGNVAAVVTGKDHSITIAPSLCIKTPTKGKVAFSDVGRYIAEQDGQTPARKVVIGVAAPTFTDGLGKADCTFDTYTKGRENEKGYTFAGWFGDDGKELTSAADATVGTTYTAKWTKNGKTVRTAVLDLTEINEENTFGATLADGVYTNADEGWSWNPKTETLTLSGVTFDVNKQSTEPNIEGIGAILLPRNASVTTKKGTENTVHNGSTIGTKLGTYIGSGIVSGGAFTIKGDGELSVTAGAFGVLAMGDVSIGAPISIVCTETKGNVAAVVTGKDHSITIAPSLCIKTPTKGKVASSDVGRYIAEQDGQTPARKVVIGYTVPSSSGGSSGSGGSSSGNSSTISTPSAKNGTVSVSPKSASKGTTVTVTVTPDKGYVLETLTVTDASGKKLDLKNLGSGKYSFTMPASKVEVKATFMEDNTMLNYFVDVPASAYYYDAVLWAAEQGITGGTDATHFSPDGVCTRAQAVTFLWRAAGSPAPSATAMPFTDVAADSYYYNAVLWAMENGITVGTSSTTFSPDLKCSRAHIMTFLWRSEKSPAAGSVNPFTDVSADAYYADAVLWAVKESVTNGTSSATFSPDADCTRAQIVTFIWRTLAR